MKKVSFFLFSVLVLAACSYQKGELCYNFGSYNNSGVKAQIILSKHNGSIDTTDMTCLLKGIKAGGVYDAHIHDGPPANYLNSKAFIWEHITRDNNPAIISVPYSLSFLENFDGTLVVHDVLNADERIVIEGFGINYSE